MKKFLTDIVVCGFTVLSFVCLFVFLQTHHIWGSVHIEQILIHITEGVDFAPDQLKYGYIVSIILGIVSAVACSVFLCNKTLVIVSAFICFFITWQIGGFSYFLNKKIYSKLYETEYLQPNNLHFEFLSGKRNLIVAYLESMEENYATDLQTNLIPNMHAMSSQSLSFPGFHQIAFQDYTIAGLVESMCAVVYRGTSLKGYDAYRNFLTNLVCYPQILQQNGYQTVFMKSADINFSRTGLFLKTHGFQEALGAHELDKQFQFPLKQNRGAFGGYHDKALYEMIKEKITELSHRNKPFFFSFLTLDTHTPDYFVSPDCPTTSSKQADAVSCADSMLAKFISWLKEQPFWPNTTVVVLGDHPQTGINRLYPKLHKRKIVNFILNPAPAFSKAPHTSWTTLDVAPTILNAIGISFDKQAFGLGRSLFASEPTLYEKLGHKLETEVFKTSEVYQSFEEIKNKSLPQYTLYTPLNREISALNDIQKFATFSNEFFSAVFLEEMSFTLPPVQTDLTFHVKFKVMLSAAKEKFIRVYANNTLVQTWRITSSDRQPLLKEVLIPSHIIKQNKLLIRFETDDENPLSEAIGIGVFSFSIQDDKH